MPTLSALYKEQTRFYPALICFHEKHDDCQYILESSSGLLKMALDVVEKRLQNETYTLNDIEPTFEEFFENVIGMSIQEFDKMFKDKTKFAHVAFKGIAVPDIINKLETGYKNKERENEMLKEAQKAVEEKDGKMALKIIEKRKDYEYEQYTIINNVKAYD